MTRSRSRRMTTAMGALVLALARPALAGEAGPSNDASPAADDAALNDAASGPPPVPLACDGALCDTTNGAETGGSCSVSRPGWLQDADARGAPTPIAWAVLCASLLRRARRRTPPVGAEAVR
jgi:hypothetical protein